MQVTILMGRLMTSVMTTGMLEPISFTSLRSFTHSVTTTVPVIRLSLDAAEHTHLRPALSVLGPPVTPRCPGNTVFSCRVEGNRCQARYGRLAGRGGPGIAAVPPTRHRVGAMAAWPACV